MSYTPKPGTVAWRAMQHLESMDIGAEITTSALSDALNVPTSSLVPCLTAALENGVLFKRQKDKSSPRSPVFWSLTNYSEGEKPPPLSSRSVFDLGNSANVPMTATDVQRRQARSAVDLVPMIDKDLMRLFNKAQDLDNEVNLVAPPVPPVASTATMRIALWSDGVLQVQHPEGRMTTFTADETRQLVDFLDRVLTDRVGA